MKNVYSKYESGRADVHAWRELWRKKSKLETKWVVNSIFKYLNKLISMAEKDNLPKLRKENDLKSQVNWGTRHILIFPPRSI